MSASKFSVAVIMQRTPLANRWVDERWEPVAVETISDAAGVGADPVAPAADARAGGEATRVADEATGGRWRFAGHAIEFHRSEAEGYYLNLTAPDPKVFVMWRVREMAGDPPVCPVVVTVSYNEAARMLDGGEQVDAVPMPADIRGALGQYVAAHYRPEPKRKLRRNDPFADDAHRRTREGRR